jgi:predicted nucleic acid-binding protein
VPEKVVIADTGPLIAFLVEREPRHRWAVQQFKSLPAPFLTCEAVLTEAFHLLSRTHKGPRRLFQMLERGLFVVDFAIITHVKGLEKLIQKYQDLPMSLADACLVKMAEIHANSVVLTLDQHFRIYRKPGRQALRLVAPEE